MNDQQAIQAILCVILGLCGYFCLLSYFSTRAAHDSAPYRAGGLLLIMYAFIIGLFSLIVARYAGTAMLFPALAALTICVFAATAASNIGGRWRDVSVLPALLLLCYLGLLASVTLFSRENSSAAVILLQFDALVQYLKYGNSAALMHLLLNIVMFIPLGVLLPLTVPFSPAKLLDVLSTALLLTAMIEGGQFLWQLGQVDVEDLAANTAGAALGYALYLLLIRWQTQRLTRTQE